MFLIDASNLGGTAKLGQVKTWHGKRIVKHGGRGTLPQIHDGQTGEMVTVGPPRGMARLYACGITPYDATHLGHAFTYVTVDLLHRAWLDAGLQVAYAQNVTDVDDPLLERAIATGQLWDELAAQQTELFRSDMEALNVLPPQTYRGVVESLPLIVDMIGQLAVLGLAYRIGSPDATGQGADDWYFVFEEEGDVALFAERGGDPEREGKRHPLDPLLWRAQREGEPAWDSPLGRGRPGWHIECAAIASKALGAYFDVQAGGNDLIFPHHRMCAEQVQRATGHPYAKAYLNVAMVGFGGEKMSKSRGNLVFVSQLLQQGADPMALRLCLLDHHYRQDWEYTPDHLAQGASRLANWRAACMRPSAAEAPIAAIRAAIAADLNAPAALRIIDEWAASSGFDKDAPQEMLQIIDSLLGIIC